MKYYLFIIFKEKREKSWVWLLLNNLFSKGSQCHLPGENLYSSRQLIPKGFILIDNLKNIAQNYFSFNAKLLMWNLKGQH